MFAQAPVPMPPMELIILSDVLPTAIVAVAGLAAFGLLMRAWSRRAIHRGEAAKIQASLEVIHNAIEDLRLEQESLALDVRDRVADLSGRVEFAERLLARGRDQEQ